MKNRPLPRTSHDATGLRGLLCHLFGRSGAETCKGKIIKVWDMQRDSYRDVNLNDRNDPLWPTARELYLFTKSGAGRSAA